MAKKDKTPGSSGKKGSPDKKSPRKQKRKAGGEEVQEGAANTYRILVEGGSFLPELERILELCGDEPYAGVAELINVILLACGAEGIIEPWQVEADDPNDTLAAVFDRMSENIEDRYPLASRDKKWKKFKTSYPDFWCQLMKRASSGMLYDATFADTLIGWAGVLCGSKVRAFRHQGMVAVYGMIAGMVDVCAELEGLVEKLAKGKRGKVEHDLETKKGRVVELIKLAYDCSCISRYRDVIPEIRMESLAEQGKWSLKLPSLFVQDSYTKYLGWSLFDKDPTVRRAALVALEGIYGLPDAYRMHAFTARFLPRVKEMTLDVSPVVAQQALKLICVLLRNEHGNLEEVFPDDVQNTFLEFVFDEKQCIRQAAGGVFKLILKIRTLAQLGESPTARQASLRRLDILVSWLQASSHPRAADCVVDSLLLHGADRIFKDFPRLTEIAQADDPAEEIGLPSASSDNVVRASLSLLLSLMKKASNQFNIYVSSKDDQPQQLTKGEQNKLAAGWKELGEALVKHLRGVVPGLLVKCKAEPRLVEVLASLVEAMDPTTWEEGGKKEEKEFDKLLDSLSTLYVTLVDQGALQRIARAWRHITSSSFGLRDTALLAWRKVAGTLFKRLAESGKQRKDKLSWVQAWRRVAIALSQSLDISDELWGKVADYFTGDTAHGEELPDAISSATYSALLRAHKVMREGDKAIDLRGDLATLLPSLGALLEATNPLEVRKQAFRALSILWPIACPTNFAEQPSKKEQENFAVTFDEAVTAILAEKGKKRKEEAARQGELEEHISSMVRLVAIGVLEDIYSSAVLIKWPVLHAKGQEIVKALYAHLRGLGKIWGYEADTITLAHDRLVNSPPEKAEEAERVLFEVCQKLALSHSFNPDKDGIHRLLSVVEAYAAEDVKARSAILAAVVPFARFLTKRDAASLLATFRGRGYTADDDETLASHIDLFQRGLMKPAGEEVQGEAPVAKKPRPAKRKEEVPSSVESSRPRSAKRLFDDEDEEAINTAKKTKTSTTASTYTAAAPSSGKKSSVRTPTDLSNNFDAVSSVDLSPSKRAKSESDVSMAFEGESQSVVASQESIAPKVPRSRKRGTLTLSPKATVDTEHEEHDEDDDIEYSLNLGSEQGSQELFSASKRTVLSSQSSEDASQRTKSTRVSQVSKPIRQKGSKGRA